MTIGLALLLASMTAPTPRDLQSDATSAQPPSIELTSGYFVQTTLWDFVGGIPTLARIEPPPVPRSIAGCARHRVEATSEGLLLGPTSKEEAWIELSEHAGP